MENTQTPLLSWTAHIHPHHERGTTWFIFASVLTILLFAYSLYTKAWSFSLLIIMTTAVYWFIHRHKPEERTMAIYDWGFNLNGRAVEWENCTGFWFLQGMGHLELHIEHNHKIVGDFIIQTGELDIEEIHRVLINFLPELENKRESRLDTLARICKI